MATYNPGGYHKPGQEGFIKALVRAINENKTELGTKSPKAPKAPKK